MSYKKLLCTIIVAIISGVTTTYLLIVNINIDNLNVVTAQGLNIKKYIGMEKTEFKNCQGSNINIAIIDSGIAEHSDINFKKIIYFKDFTSNIDRAYDDNGHGTFVAGIIGADGNIKGIAPKANLIILKVLDMFGNTDRDTLLSSLRWIYDNFQSYKIKVVNISIGVIPYLSYKDDSLCKLIKKINDKGIVIVCSAGNIEDTNSVLSPGISPDVITVGSCKNNRTYDIDDDVIASFSAHSEVFKSFIKPDLVTLGVDILSLDYRSKNAYITHSGTSFSCAIVTGIAALLCEKYPSKSSEDIKKYIFINTVKLKHESEINQGNGEIFIK